jgi:5-methylcytosine-specific restriction endonuclease McrA
LRLCPNQPTMQSMRAGGEHREPARDDRGGASGHGSTESAAESADGAVVRSGGGVLAGAAGHPLQTPAHPIHSEGLDAKVLVLNRMYVAVKVISARRAFLLLAREIAEVIHVEREAEQTTFRNYDIASWFEASAYKARHERDKHDWVKTVRLEIAVPRIIRLLGYERFPEQHVKLNRRNLMARDRNRCQYCGHIFPTSELSLDHVVPRSQGGGDSWENLVCACVACNARKGGRTPVQASMRLIRKPVRPKRHPLITIRLGHAKYESWKSFLDEAYWSVELG